MTLCAVVAYPRCTEQHAAWIETVRSAHDPQAALIRAHFTVVFPTPISAAVVVSEAERAVAGRKSFSVTFASAVATRDMTRPRSHVFLVPSSGSEEVASLHDSLYGDALRPHLRREIAYVPRVTIAEKRSHDECLALAAELNRGFPSFGGTIDQIDVISVGADTVATIAAFCLK